MGTVKGTPTAMAITDQATPKWALILGVSSGFGAAAARAWAADGFNIIGVHLDRRAAQPAVDALSAELRQTGRDVHFFNENAASDTSRAAMIEAIAPIVNKNGGSVAILLHSLAFGTLRPLVPAPDRTNRAASRRQLEMTIDVMANSLVYWTQDLLDQQLLHKTRIFAMTSAGSQAAWPNYGPVSAAKAALETHVRQLCMELAPYQITINAILAGVTETAALKKIPGHEQLMAGAKNRNPHNRLTQPEDVAACLVALSRPETYWMTGNTIRVDGGENFCA